MYIIFVWLIDLKINNSHVFYLNFDGTNLHFIILLMVWSSSEKSASHACNLHASYFQVVSLYN